MTYAYSDEIDLETGTQYYVLNSFNDIATSLVLLFELLIVNNWMVNVRIIARARVHSVTYVCLSALN